jgi:hypothetical protein
VIELLDTEFWFIIGFSELLKLITTSNYTVSWIRTLNKSLQHLLSLLSLLCLHRLSGNGFLRRGFLSFLILQLLSLLAAGYLTSQLRVAWSQSSNKGYSSCPYSSRIVFPNRRLKTTLLCRWPPRQDPGPPQTVSGCLPSSISTQLT